MEIFFYKISGDPVLWYTNYNGVALSEWCFENDVSFKIEYYDGYKTGIMLLKEKDRVYFLLRWGDAPRTLEDYID